MRKIYISKKLFVFSCLLLCASSVFAQSGVGELIKSGPADATKLAQAYLNPFFKGIGVGLNSGWHNTANVKNVGRFELRLGATGVSVPQSDRTFDVTKLGLSNSIRPSNTNNVISPTSAGSKSNGPSMDIYDSNGQKIDGASFRLPGGTGLSIVPVPQLQGSIGLPKGIELDLRATPTINLGKDYGKVGMIGGGIKVEVLQLITGKTAKKLLPIDLAVAVGYTQINYELDLDVKPSNNAKPDGQQNNDFSGQKVDAKISGINAEAILSKKLLFFTPFLSVGYNGATTKADVMGNYPITTGYNPTPIVGGPVYTTVSNPISINQKDISGLRTNLGFQLNLAFFRMYASYSMAEYNAFNAGIGIGIGK